MAPFNSLKSRDLMLVLVIHTISAHFFFLKNVKTQTKETVDESETWVKSGEVTVCYFGPQLSLTALCCFSVTQYVHIYTQCLYTAHVMGDGLLASKLLKCTLIEVRRTRTFVSCYSESICIHCTIIWKSGPPECNTVMPFIKWWGFAWVLCALCVLQIYSADVNEIQQMFQQKASGIVPRAFWINVEYMNWFRINDLDIFWKHKGRWENVGPPSSFCSLSLPLANA